jgi:hypothetical protein
MYTRYAGKQKLTQVQSNLQKVVKDMRKRCEIPRDAEVRIEDLECKVQFKVDNKWVYVSAVHDKEDGTTYEEMLTVDIKLNAAGKPITAKDSEYSPIIDETMQKLLDGSYVYEEIKSAYEDEELHQLDILQADDIKAVRYDIIEEDGSIGWELVRYYKGDMLVFEGELNKDWNKEGDK